MSHKYSFIKFSRQSSKGVIVIYGDMLIKILKQTWVLFLIFVSRISQISEIQSFYMYLGIFSIFIFTLIRAYLSYRNFKFKINTSTIANTSDVSVRCFPRHKHTWKSDHLSRTSSWTIVQNRGAWRSLTLLKSIINAIVDVWRSVRVVACLMAINKIMRTIFREKWFWNLGETFQRTDL